MNRIRFVNADIRRSTAQISNQKRGISMNGLRLDFPTNNYSRI